MRIEESLSRFYIYRNDSVFCFFVGHDKSSWSSKCWQGQSFASCQEAEECMAEIKRRAAQAGAGRRGRR